MKRVRSRLVSVLLVAVVAALSLGDLSAQSLSRVDRVSIVDADGRTVGAVRDIEHADGQRRPYLLFKLGNRLIELAVEPDGFYPVTRKDLRLVYETHDCSGPAYMQPGADNVFFDSPIVSAPGQTLYLPDGDAEEEYRTFGSEMLQDGRCIGTAAAWMSVPAVASVDMAHQFKMPLRMEPGCFLGCESAPIELKAGEYQRFAGAPDGLVEFEHDGRGRLQQTAAPVRRFPRRALWNPV